jgi:RNA polymerase sigma-70 factor (sigma-E family)
VVIRVLVLPGFDEFVERSSTGLLRTAVLLVDDRGDAEDLLQLTLLRVAVRWSAASRAPEAYAREVLVNLSRDRWRRLRRRVRPSPLHGVSEIAAAGADDDRVVERDRMIRALHDLPVRQREVIVLRFYADLTVEQTAAAIGISPGTVKSHTSRAMAALARTLTSNLNVVNDERPEVRDGG